MRSRNSRQLVTSEKKAIVTGLVLRVAIRKLRAFLQKLWTSSARSISRFVVFSDSCVYIRGPDLGLLAQVLSQSGKTFPGVNPLAVWYPLSPLFLRDWVSMNVSLMSQFPRGRLGNRIFELAIGMQISDELGGLPFVMVAKKCLDDEKFFYQVLEGLAIQTTTRASKLSPILKGNIHSGRRSRVVQLDFLELAMKVAEIENDLLQRAFSNLRKHQNIVSDKKNDLKSAIVIHFRATDRLDSPQHWENRPPPLAFFRKAVSLEACESLLLLTDDPKSRLVVKLAQQLRSDGVHVSIRKGPINEDFFLMTGAETLILPGSSLSDSAAGLSRNLKRIYVYGGRTRIRNDVEVVELWDSSKRWENDYRALGDNFATGIGKLMQDVAVDSITHRRLPAKSA